MKMDIRSWYAYCRRAKIVKLLRSKIPIMILNLWMFKKWYSQLCIWARSPEPPAHHVILISQFNALNHVIIQEFYHLRIMHRLMAFTIIWLPMWCGFIHIRHSHIRVPLFVCVMPMSHNAWILNIRRAVFGLIYLLSARSYVSNWLHHFVSRTDICSSLQFLADGTRLFQYFIKSLSTSDINKNSAILNIWKWRIYISTLSNIINVARHHPAPLITIAIAQSLSPTRTCNNNIKKKKR